MTVMEAIQERHSVRHYAAKPVEEEKLQKGAIVLFLLGGVSIIVKSVVFHT